MEKKMMKQDNKMKKYGHEIQIIFGALKELLNPPQKPRPKVGFEIQGRK
jgi:hypothetical protein